MMPDEPLRRANAQLSAAFMGTPQVLHDPSKHRTGNSTTVMLRSTYLDLEHIVGDDSDHSPRPGDPLRTADAAQLADAFRCYSGDLYRVARRRLGDNALAEEAVQETFLRAWRAINRFDPNIGSWRMWLFAICRNAVIDVARRRTRDARTDRATGDSEGGQRW